MSDLIKIVDIYPELLDNKDTRVFYCVIQVAPYSKSNNLMKSPRGFMYIPAEFKQWDKEVRMAVLLEMRKHEKKLLEGPLMMHIDGYYATRRVVDAPNLSKSICDTLNDVLYYDDRQIISCTTTKSYDKENPRIEILVKEFQFSHDLVNVETLKPKESDGTGKCITKQEKKQKT